VATCEPALAEDIPSSTDYAKVKHSSNHHTQS
jgi:hypothetical protein